METKRISKDRQGFDQKLPLLVSVLEELDVARHISDPRAAFMTALDSLSTVNSELLSSLSTQEAEASKLFDEVRAVIQALIHQSQFQPLQKEICVRPVAGDGGKPAYALQLVSFPSNPLFILRRYTFVFKLVSLSGHPLPPSFFCVLWLREATPSGTEIKLTRKGTVYTAMPFLNGQLTRQFSDGGSVVFPGIVFNDITKGLPNHRVSLVVRSVDVERVKPLAIEGIRVKARRRQSGN